MIDAIAIIGHPSHLGGADTELDHQITCWQALGVVVHICPTGELDNQLKAMNMASRGCIYHAPRDWKSLRGLPCISYCNGIFLDHIAEIKKYVKCTIWANCMCWLFEQEKVAHKNGLIDYFIYQTNHARHRVENELIKLNPNFKWVRIAPYFDISKFPYFRNRPSDAFRFCRISRCDQDKFNAKQWWIYETMTAPVLKDGLVLGFDRSISPKTGPPPAWIKTAPAGSISVHDVYKQSDCFIMASDTYENLPRVGFEAMASGCLLIVDNRGGWTELIQHRQNGYLCNNEREFAYYASRAAFERNERLAMADNARNWVEKHWGLETAQQRWKQFFDIL